jgi:hypothetical protein
MPIPMVSGNTVFNIKPSASLSLAGIELNAGIAGGSVVGNTITGLHSSGSFPTVYGINLSSGTNTSGVLIANNMVSDLKAVAYSSTSPYTIGIRIAGGTNSNVVFNSVNLFGDVPVSTSTAANGGSSASISIVSNYTGLQVRNNIFLILKLFLIQLVLQHQMPLQYIQVQQLFQALH